MSDMQRYYAGEVIGDGKGPFVLASDTQAAIAAAELEGFNRGWNHGSDAGAQAMLARAIAAVEALAFDHENGHGVLIIPTATVLAALRALGGDDE